MSGNGIDFDDSGDPWLKKMEQKVEQVRQVADDVRQSRTDFSHKLAGLAAGTIAVAASAAGVVIVKGDISLQMRAYALYFLAASATCMLVALTLSLGRVHLENLILDDEYKMLLSDILQEIMKQHGTHSNLPRVPENAFVKLEERENELATRMTCKVRLGNWLNIAAIVFFCMGYLAIVVLMWMGARKL